MTRLDDMPSPFRLGLGRTEMLSDGAEMAAVFARHRAVALTDVFDPKLFDAIMVMAGRATYVRDVATDAAMREREQPGTAGAMIGMAIARDPLTQWLNGLFGGDTLAGFASSGIFRNHPEDKDYLKWHDDVSPPYGTARRRIAMTIGLSTEDHDGGEFTLRRKETGEVLAEHRHEKPGSMLLFDVNPSLEHRVTPLSSGGPRTVFIGWFVAPTR